jgi:XTP/dITP diphosphohydrolase
LRELEALLAPLEMSLTLQSDLGVPGVVEAGTTFVENAILKARHASAASGLPSIADDSGLLVDVLDGAPGVYSARYAGANATDESNVAKLLRTLSDVPEDQRRAHFHCTTVFLSHAADPAPLIGEGRWHGSILLQPRGGGGFGYDPVFYVEEYRCSSAELPAATKNALSHRGKAMRALLASLRQR